MPTLSQDQVLSEISEFFHADYQLIADTVLQGHEQIIWAGNHSYGRSPVGEHGGMERFGYLLVTSYRIVLVSFPEEYGWFRRGGRERIYLEGSHIEEFAYGAPSRPLTEYEINGRSVSEALLRNIVSVERKDYQAKQRVAPKFVRLVVQFLPDRSWTFLLHDPGEGQELYDILQHAVSNPPNEPGEGLLTELERLSAMHRRGDLDDDEFDRAKGRLLER